jgi:hypothetical protein
MFISIATSPRPQDIDYLSKTIKSLNNGGAASFSTHEKMIFQDGGFDRSDNKLYYGWDTVYNRGPSGSRVAFWRIFHYFFNYTKEDKLLFCEDDILVCKNVLLYIDSIKMPDDLPLITFHDTMNEVSPSAKIKTIDGKYVTVKVPHGIYKTPISGRRNSGFGGTQMFLIKREAIELLLRYNPLTLDLGKRFEGIDNSKFSKILGDTCISYILEKEKYTNFGIQFPCLANHVGSISIEHPSSSYGKSGKFIGEEFDAWENRKVLSKMSKHKPNTSGMIVINNMDELP